MSDLRGQPAPEIENQDKIWDYYQADTTGLFDGSRGRLQYLAAQIAPAARVLNIGVGDGLFEEIAHQRGLEIHALDPSARSIERLRSRVPIGEKAQVGYSQAMPFSTAYFDAVVISEVLEHLSDEVLTQSLAEIARVLRPGGEIIGTVPAREDLQANLVVCPDCGKLFHRWGHMQSFDSTRMHSLLSRHFVPIEIRERPFATWSVLNWKGRIALTMKMALWGLGVHGGGESLYFRARNQTNQGDATE